MNEISSRQYQLAQELIELKRWTEAIILLSKVLAENPQDFKATCALSQCFYELQNFDEALSKAENAILLAPEHEWGYRLKSLVLSRLGRKKESLTCAERAVKLAPTEQFPLQTLVHIYLENHKIQKALAVAEKLRNNYPEAEASFLALGNVYLQKGKPGEAENFFRQALRINPNNSNTRNSLGTALLERERQKPLFSRNASWLDDDCLEKEVNRHFTDALRLAPNNIKIIENIKDQFSYAPLLFLSISLLPFLFLIFLVVPVAALLIGAVGFTSLLVTINEKQRLKKTTTSELKIFFKRKPFSEYFEMFSHTFQNVFKKCWPPHLLASFAVIIRFLASLQPPKSDVRSFLLGTAVVLLIVSGIWLVINLIRHNQSEK